jgi:hypothetical protein
VAYHTIEDGPWPQGVTVAVYPVGSVDVGSPIDVAVAQPDGTATFGGLTEGAQYTAVGSGGTQTFYARNQESSIAVIQEAPLNVKDERFAGGAALTGGTDDWPALSAARALAVTAPNAEN